MCWYSLIKYASKKAAEMMAHSCSFFLIIYQSCTLKLARSISATPGASGLWWPLPVSRASMDFISSSVSLKSKMSMFSLILFSWVDFGRTMNPS